MNFALSGLILTVFLFFRFILPLPVKIKYKGLLTVLVVLGTTRLAVMRRIFGGLGAIEAPRWLLLGSSFLQNLALMLLLLILARDIILLLSLLAGLRKSKKLRKTLVGLRAAMVFSLLAAFLAGFGLYGAAKVPEVNQSEVIVSNWPKELDGIRVAVLADMHISRFFDGVWVRKVVELTNAQKPDMIWFPGDMVDGTPANRAPDVAPLSDLKAPYGIYGCLGNHEYISGVTDWLPVFKKLGIEILYNSHVLINAKGVQFILAGVTDLTASRRGQPGPDLHKALLDSPSGLSAVLLDHRPGQARKYVAEDRRIVFQVSGHTHGGMMPILKTFVKRANGGFVSGLYELEQAKLFVAPGLGLWSGFPMRILNPSQITVLTIRTG